MKKLFICIAAVAISVSASAQDFTWGVRAGMNISSLSVKNSGEEGLNPKSTIGFNVGVMGDYAFSKSFSIESGLYFTQLGAKANVKFDNGSYETKINLNYLQLPVLATYHLAISDNAKWSIQAGPYFAVGLGGKVKTENTFAGQTEKYEANSFGDGKTEDAGMLQRFDMGVAFGTGVTFGKVYVGVKYDLGLSNILAKELEKDTDNNKLSNGNISINLGYNF